MAKRIHPITVPKWGIEMQEGTITEWRAEVGDAIDKDQELVDIETDKIVNTLESPASGVLRRQLVETGETLKVGELLGILAPADVSDEDIDGFISAFVPADASFGVGDSFEATPAAEQPAPEPNESAPDASEVEPGGASKASPVARRLAEKLGVDLSRVKGTGRNGRISTEDVEAAASNAATADVKPPGAGGPAGTPLSSRALTQARRMTESKQTIPHFYLVRDLDMSNAVAQQRSSGLPLTAIIVQAMVKALKAEPSVNHHFRDNRLLTREPIGINVAVDTSEGLVAPLLDELDTLEAAEIATRLKALAARARERSLNAEDLKPGGITLSNLGMFGISGFSAIINPPQVAILATGAVRPMQLEVDGPMVPSMSATLSCDHRAIDGATGARFLAALQASLNEHGTSG